MGGRDSLGVWDGHVHTATFKMRKQQRPTDSTENSAQGSMAAWTGAEFEREWICVCVWLSSFAIYLKLSYHCLSQYKNPLTHKNSKQNPVP